MKGGNRKTVFVRCEFNQEVTLMKNYVDGKVIVITGASDGFGRSLAQKTAEMGAKVVCAARREEKLKEIVDGIKAKGQSAEYVVTDVSDRKQVEHMIDFAVKTYGAVDVLVNNAGIMPLAFFEDHHKAIDKWERCIDTNTKGTLFGICAVYDQMIKQGHGHIINLDSIYGNWPSRGAAVYGMTKNGNGFLADALRLESKGKINVTTVRPTGCRPTGLTGQVVNPKAIEGILVESSLDDYFAIEQSINEGKESEYSDPESMKYFVLSADILVDSMIYCINQPLGVSISDITVRATGEYYMI